MKVLLLTKYGRKGASSRHRFYQFLPELEKSGMRFTVAPLLDDAYIKARHAGRRPSLWRLFQAYMRRMGYLFVVYRFDLVWLEKELFPLMPAWGEIFLSLIGRNYVVDYDDATFHSYEFHPNSLVRRFLRTKIDIVMRHAYAVVAGNAYLAKRAQKAGAARVFVIPTLVDVNRYDSHPKSYGSPFTIGWIGSPTMAGHLQLIRPALARLTKQNNARVVLVGSGPIDLPGVRFEVFDWTEETEVAALASFDVGVAPMCDGPWERGKCGYKILQYMAGRLPVIASPVGVAKELVEPGVTGFLAETTEDYICALEKLRSDPMLRARMGVAARARVESLYSTQASWHDLYHILREAIRTEPVLPPQRLMHVITELGVGGAESVLSSLVLSQRGDSNDTVEVVSLTPGGYYREKLEHAGVRVRDVGMHRSLLNPLGMLRLAAHIRRQKPSIIQSWMYHADLVTTLALALSGRWRRTRLFWGIRCSDMDFAFYGLLLRLTVWACASLSRLPHGIIANSEKGIEVHRRIGYKPKRFFNIDNGIEAKRFRQDATVRNEVRIELGIASEASLLAMVARVDPMKDHNCFLAALARLPGVQALAIGRGTESLPDRPGLHRLGQRHDVPRLLAACDILVSSSAFGEGFSNVIAEGMAAGLAVVATDVGDVRRIVRDTGLIVPPKDPVALARAIQYLVDNPEERRALGVKARERIAKNFSLDRAVRAWAEAYQAEISQMDHWLPRRYQQSASGTN